MNGWIKLHRELLKKAIWKDSTSDQRSILVTLLLMASHEGNEWIWRGEKYTVSPGQFVTSLESIAQKTGKGVTVQMVRTSLLKFEKLGFLTNESTNKNRLITIVNWESYQSEEEKLTGKLTGNQQATNKQPTTIKNDKNDKNIYNPLTPLKGNGRFDDFWSVYPKKVGKAKTEAAWQKAKLDEIADQIIEAVNRFRKSEQWTKDGGRFIPNPLTFINGRRWEDQLSVDLTTPALKKQIAHLEAWKNGRRFFHEGHSKTYQASQLQPWMYNFRREPREKETPDSFRVAGEFSARFEEFVIEEVNHD